MIRKYNLEISIEAETVSDEDVKRIFKSIQELIDKMRLVQLGQFKYLEEYDKQSHQHEILISKTEE